MQMLMEGLKIIGIGIGGVFTVLALFYGMIRALTAMFPEKEKTDDQKA